MKHFQDTTIGSENVYTRFVDAYHRARAAAELDKQINDAMDMHRVMDKAVLLSTLDKYTKAKARDYRCLNYGGIPGMKIMPVEWPGDPQLDINHRWK